MNGFDWEPEDTWDIEDSVCAQIDNLLKRLDLLDGQRDPAGRWRGMIVDLEHRVRPWVEQRDTGRLNEREVLRVDQLVEDLEFVRDRDSRGY